MKTRGRLRRSFFCLKQINIGVLMIRKIVITAADLQDLIGSNRKYVEALPFNLEKLKVSSLSKLVKLSDIIVITHRNEKIKKVTRFLSNNQFLFDATGLFNSPPKIDNYEGVCW